MENGINKKGLLIITKFSNQKDHSKMPQEMKEMKMAKRIIEREKGSRNKQSLLSIKARGRARNC